MQEHHNGRRSWTSGALLRSRGLRTWLAVYCKDEAAWRAQFPAGPRGPACTRPSRGRNSLRPSIMQSSPILGSDALLKSVSVNAEPVPVGASADFQTTYRTEIATRSNKTIIIGIRRSFHCLSATTQAALARVKSATGHSEPESLPPTP